MNNVSTNTLKVLRKIYRKCSNQKQTVAEHEKSPEKAADIIYTALRSENSCMIARFGSTEMACLRNYIGVHSEEKNILKFIQGQASSWWWEDNIIKQMQQWSGFFPARIDKIERFCEVMIKDIPEVDILGSWLPDESLFNKELENSQKINFELLNPYFSTQPWTRALKGKKVLVVHPFANTIEQQYKKRTQLFANNLLPEFELKTIKAVQSIAGNSTEFSDWFAALNYMKSEIDKQDYDICLIGCGAYGFPLAAHVKRMGKKSVQLGGALQLLFGIIGKRWETTDYSDEYNYAALINEHWVKPAEEDKPSGANKVENACYW